MPGFAPFLLCDLRVRTRWSDGHLSVREVIDLYGRSGQFDVMAITDRVAAPPGLSVPFRRRAVARTGASGLRAEQWDAYLDDVSEEAARACREFGMLVIPGLEVTPAGLPGRRQAPITALGVQRFIPSGQPAASIRAAIRQQDALELGAGADHADIRGAGHHYAWKTLVRAEPAWSSVREALLHDSDVALTLLRLDSCAA